MFRLLITLSFILTPRAQTDESQWPKIWVEAETLVRNGVEKRSPADFRRAAHLYVQLERDGMTCPELSANLGETYLRTRQLPEAIRAAHQGLALAPADDRLRRLLDRARADVIYPVNSSLRRPNDFWFLWLPRLTPQFMTALAILALFVAAILVPRGLRRSHAGLLVMGGASFALSIGIFVFSGPTFAQNRELVVIRDDVPLRVGNAASYPAHAEVPFVPRGLEVHRRYERGGWIRIECPSGAAGWVPQEDIFGLK